VPLSIGGLTGARATRTIPIRPSQLWCDFYLIAAGYSSAVALHEQRGRTLVITKGE